MKMNRLIDSINSETIVKIGMIILVLGFFLMALGFLIAICGVMLGDWL